MAGYSTKSLKEKLGLSEDKKILVINAPDDYYEELNFHPKSTGSNLDGYDFIHFFTKSKSELEEEFPRLVSALKKNGMLWISWPKGSSKVETDLNENVIREIGLRNGLVDVKVAAVTEIWSGLKFVFRLKDR